MWRPIPRYPNYEVSRSGNIRNATTKRVLLPGRTEEGYVRTALGYIHRFVAETYLGPVGYGKEINHKNSIRHDNRLSNLEIVTRLENAAHGARRRYSAMVKGGL